ncbi:Srpra [Scenedesmus sp. PABB004]|nr:Srpra [Scenedesmus sp. PABB004]
MLDYFAIFTKGGALLWTLQFTTALKHHPLDALNALIRTCLLEERSGDAAFTYTPKAGAAQALKWTFHNVRARRAARGGGWRRLRGPHGSSRARRRPRRRPRPDAAAPAPAAALAPRLALWAQGLGLVFVAVYQKSLSLLYVDELLARARDAFVETYAPGAYDFPGYADRFARLLRDCEARADAARRAAALPKAAPPPAAAGKAGRAGGGAPGAAGSGAATPAGGGSDGSGGSDGDDGGAGSSNGAAGGASGGSGSGSGSSSEDEPAPAANGGAAAGSPDGGGFDLAKLRSVRRKAAAGPPGRRAARRGPGELEKPKEAATAPSPAKKKRDRVWGGLGRKDSVEGRIDYSEGAPGANGHGLPHSVSAEALGTSRMDDDDEGYSDSELDIDEDELVAAAKGAAPAKRGVLGAFVGKLALSVVGSSALTAEELAPALSEMKAKLMERNVAEEIAGQVVDSVARSLEGKKLASFTGVGHFVRRAFEDALSAILNKRQVDVLGGIARARARGKPYVIVFCGVNGVGKSTNLAKIAYWLGQHGAKVQLAACDTFRAGAVEQLKTHAARLGVPLYERGYEKDPAKIAAEAVRVAARDGRDVVLVDTAGRMQDNEPLMRALSGLIALNEPELVLFVGEALVGNDAVDQLVKFNRSLADLAPGAASGGPRTRQVIDGIVLTKFDTIDDKVGAALSMVYASGAPVMFVGCGQTYVDLKKLNVRAVVNSLLNCLPPLPPAACRRCCRCTPAMPPLFTPATMPGGGAGGAGGALRVVSWNLLADKYSACHAHYCPAAALALPARLPKILARLEALAPDLLMLQEVEEMTFRDGLQPWLAGRGWSSMWHPRAPPLGVAGPPEGVSLHWRDAAFSVLASRGVTFADALAAPGGGGLPGTCCGRHAARGAGGARFHAALAQRGEGAALALLRHEQSGAALLACSTHLFCERRRGTRRWAGRAAARSARRPRSRAAARAGNPLHPDIKVAQAALLCSSIAGFLAEQGLAAGDVPLAIGGDLNSLPSKWASDQWDEVPPGETLVSGVFELLSTGELGPAHQDHPSNRSCAHCGSRGRARRARERQPALAARGGAQQPPQHAGLVAEPWGGEGSSSSSSSDDEQPQQEQQQPQPQRRPGQRSGNGSGGSSRGGSPGGGRHLVHHTFDTAGLRLASSHTMAHGREPALTTRTSSFSGTLDYVWLSSPHWRVAATVQLPPEAVPIAELPPCPNESEPSDHLPVGCEAVLLVDPPGRRRSAAGAAAARRWSSARGARCASSASFAAADLEVVQQAARSGPIELPHDLPFGRVFTDHMLLAEHTAFAGWGRPRIVPFGALPLHPAAQVLHYGLSCFEGMKAFPGPDGRGRLFRPDMNMARLRRSAQRLMLADFDPQELQACIAALLRVDRGWMPARPGHAMYIRPFLFGSDGALGVHASSRTTLAVILSPVGPYFPSGAAPVRLLLDTANVRAWPGGAGAHKVAGNYAPTVAPQVAAMQQHRCSQVLYTLPRGADSRDALLSECGAMNMMFVLDRRGASDGASGAAGGGGGGAPSLEVVTPPLDGTILPGVTRDSILSLLRAGRPDVAVSERALTVGELLDAHAGGRLREAFGCGTACVVQPVGTLVTPDGVELCLPSAAGGAERGGGGDDGGDGSVAEWARARLADIQYGRVESPWSVPYE